MAQIKQTCDMNPHYMKRINEIKAERMKLQTTIKRAASSLKKLGDGFAMRAAEIDVEIQAAYNRAHRLELSDLNRNLNDLRQNNKALQEFKDSHPSDYAEMKTENESIRVEKIKLLKEIKQEREKLQARSRYLENRNLDLEHRIEKAEACKKPEQFKSSKKAGSK